MNNDQLQGMWGQLVGKAKKAWGRTTGNLAKQAEGAAVELGGVIREKAGGAKAATKAEPGELKAE